MIFSTTSSNYPLFKDINKSWSISLTLYYYSGTTLKTYIVPKSEIVSAICESSSGTSETSWIGVVSSQHSELKIKNNTSITFTPVKYSVNLSMRSESQTVTCPIFNRMYVDEFTKKDGFITISGYDGIATKLNSGIDQVKYFPNAAKNYTCNQFISIMKSATGIPNSSVSNEYRITTTGLSEKPLTELSPGTTWRQLLQKIAIYLGCNVFLSSSNGGEHLCFTSYKNSASNTSYTSALTIDGSWLYNEPNVSQNTMTTAYVNTQYGTGSDDKPLLYKQSDTPDITIKNFYQSKDGYTSVNYKGLTYVCGSITSYGIPNFDIGDCLLLKYKPTGETSTRSVRLPVQNIKYTFDGGLKMDISCEYNCEYSKSKGAVDNGVTYGDSLAIGENMVSISNAIIGMTNAELKKLSDGVYGVFSDWCYNNNYTYINGGRIATGTLSTALFDATFTNDVSTIISGKLGNYWTGTKTETEIRNTKDEVLLSAKETSQSYVNSKLKSYVTSSEFKVKTDAITSEVSKKVGSDNIGTLIEQNAEHVKIAWNNCSQYMAFEDGKLNIYNSSSQSDSNKIISFNQKGMEFWRNNNYLGMAGTSAWGSGTSKGIVFDLNDYTGYMMWGAKESSSNTSYYAKILYVGSQASIDNYKKDSIYFMCDTICNSSISVANYYDSTWIYPSYITTKNLTASSYVYVGDSCTMATNFLKFDSGSYYGNNSFNTNHNSSSYTYFYSDGEYVTVRGSINSRIHVCSSSSGSNDTNSSWIYPTFIKSTSVYETSDLRSKENVKSLGDEELEKFYKIRPVKFNYKGKENSNYGVIAQELIEIIGEENNNVVTRDESGLLSVDYSKLQMLTMYALQKLNDRVKELEKGDRYNENV